jgi:hypothetical protein
MSPWSLVNTTRVFSARPITAEGVEYAADFQVDGRDHRGVACAHLPDRVGLERMRPHPSRNVPARR